jgi:hypothetical protein
LTRTSGPLTSANAIGGFERLSDHIRPSPALYEDLRRIRADVRRRRPATVARLHPPPQLGLPAGKAQPPPAIGIGIGHTAACHDAHSYMRIALDHSRPSVAIHRLAVRHAGTPPILRLCNYLSGSSVNTVIKANAKDCLDSASRRSPRPAARDVQGQHRKGPPLGVDGAGAGLAVDRRGIETKALRSAWRIRPLSSVRPGWCSATTGTALAQRTRRV